MLSLYKGNSYDSSTSPREHIYNLENFTCSRGTRINSYNLYLYNQATQFWPCDVRIKEVPLHRHVKVQFDSTCIALMKT